jgi:hypothetical protein
MLTKWISGLLLALLPASCSAGPSSFDKATTCDQLVDLAVEAIKDARDAAVNSSREDFNLLRGDAPAIVRTLDESRTATSTQFAELGCVSTEREADLGRCLS